MTWTKIINIFLFLHSKGMPVILFKLGICKGMPVILFKLGIGTMLGARFGWAYRILLMFSEIIVLVIIVLLLCLQEFDSSYGPAWHCIVGTSFGSYVTHSLGGFLYFSIDKAYVLLFRTAVEPLGH